jgi:hypothetical protein
MPLANCDNGGKIMLATGRGMIRRMNISAWHGQAAESASPSFCYNRWTVNLSHDGDAAISLKALPDKAVRSFQLGTPNV